MNTMKTTVLVVEDDHHLREALCDTLELADYETCQAASGEAALTLLERQHVDMIVSDVNMGGMDGHQLLARVKKLYPQLPFLMITAYASIDKSVDAMRNGAVDYLVKPFEPQELVKIVARFAGNAAVDEYTPIAIEPQSQQVLQLAQRVAATDSTVLISGESGTGKEVLARYIHQHSPRAKQPFVAINCAAIPENMLEATLFGYEKGAYTGAYNSAPGKFEQANGGTLLLDEISEMDIGLQAKLLRVIQEREVERLGSRKSIELDVRIIATTNRHLHEEVASHRFREDLYYRLSVFPLQWMPLRERKGDIIPIAQRLFAEHTGKMRRSPVSLDASAQHALLNHSWPGNVRELDNVVQRALIMQPGVTISAEHLRIDPFSIRAINNAPIASNINIADSMPNMAAAESQLSDLQDMAENNDNADLGDEVKRREYEIILATMKAENGRRKDVAEKLGISPRTLRYKLAQMRDSGIDLGLASGF